MDSPPPLTRRRWFPRVRFSLRTLLLLVLLTGSGATLWWNWGPWAIRTRIEEPAPVTSVFFSDDDQYVMINYVKNTPNAGGNFFLNYLDIRRVDTGFRHVLLENTNGMTSVAHAAGVYASLSAGSWFGAAPADAPQTLFDWVEKRELKCRDKFKRENDVALYFQLQRGHVLVPFGNPEKTVVYRLPNFEKEWESSGTTYQMNNAKILDDGRLMVFQQRVLEVHNFATGQVLKSPPIGEKINSLDSKGCNRFICAGFTRENGSTGTHVFDLSTGEMSRIDNAFVDDISLDGRRALLAHEGWVELVDMATRENIARLDGANSTSFSADGSLILDSANARVFEADTGRKLWDDIDGGGAIFSKNGKLVELGFEIRDARTGEMALDLKALPARTSTLDHSVVWMKKSTDFALYANKDWAVPSSAASPDENRVSIWRLTRPWQWYGPAYLPELWLTLAFASTLVWSLFRDRKVFRK